MDSKNKLNKNRNGLKFILSKKEINQYKLQGYLVLKNVLSENEMATIDPVFDHFISGKEKDKMT